MLKWWGQLNGPPVLADIIVSFQSKRDEDELLLLETPLLCILLLVGEKTEWVNSIFQQREEHGEFHTLFPRLLEQEDKLVEYFRMQPNTFWYK